MSIAAALTAAIHLKAALAAEVARAQEVRAHLRGMVTDALLQQASLRDAFNQRSAALTGDLERALAAFAAQLGLPDVTLELITQRAPFEGAQLAGILQEIRALSASLRELDALNRRLAARSLSFVNAYLTQLAPRPTAYTRRGLPPALDTTTTYSERA